MIEIKKTDKANVPYEIWIGKFQQYPMEHDDLLHLQRCLAETISLGTEETPSSNFRILNSEQYSEVSTDGRSTLWIGKKKWHIREKEEDLLEENVAALIGQSS